MFVVKLAPDDTLLWANHFGDQSGDENDVLKGLVVDDNDRIYLTGELNGNLELGQTLTSLGDRDIFFAAINP